MQAIFNKKVLAKSPKKSFKKIINTQIMVSEWSTWDAKKRTYVEIQIADLFNERKCLVWADKKKQLLNKEETEKQKLRMKRIRKSISLFPGFVCFM